MDGYRELIECGNLAIADMAQKCEAVFASHEKAHVGISGGADSDAMLDLCERVRKVQPIDITYNFIDTGLEYKATRRHLSDLEQKYDITIRHTRAVDTIPVCIKRYGQPFMSKMVSEQISALQAYGFKWEDEPVAILRAKYPNAPISALKWWANEYHTKTGVMSSYCVGRNKLLKEWIIENPPDFRISARCCRRAKKLTKHRFLVDGHFDLDMYGTRKAEGGCSSLVWQVLRCWQD